MGCAHFGSRIASCQFKGERAHLWKVSKDSSTMKSTSVLLVRDFLKNICLTKKLLFVKVQWNAISISAAFFKKIQVIWLAISKCQVWNSYCGGLLDEVKYLLIWETTEKYYTHLNKSLNKCLKQYYIKDLMRTKVEEEDPTDLPTKIGAEKMTRRLSRGCQFDLC